MIWPAILSAAAMAMAACTSKSQPNPIAAMYPNLTTGTTNGTIAILPIKLSLARQIIPKEYPILEATYRTLLPSFPEGMYPAMLQAFLDHDVRDGNSGIPDFTRGGISFPFVDRLNDGYTSMQYGNTLAILGTNLVAIAGATGYGDILTLSTFEPPCDAYEHVPGGGKGETQFKAFKMPRSNDSLVLEAIFKHIPAGEHSPYSIAFWKNVTNQPQFSNNKLVCDNFIHLFNSSVTQAPYTAHPVIGDVTAVKPIFPKSSTFKGVYGLRVDTAFIENNYLPCKSLQGYHGTGSGD